MYIEKKKIREQRKICIIFTTILSFSLSSKAKRKCANIIKSPTLVYSGTLPGRISDLVGAIRGCHCARNVIAVIMLAEYIHRILH